LDTLFDIESDVSRTPMLGSDDGQPNETDYDHNEDRDCDPKTEDLLAPAWRNGE
jgi:hypothetical protein